MAARVAVVTGGNKGIGLAITKALCQEFQGDVILTARDTSLGEAACSSLKGLGLAPKFHQLDITNKESVGDLASFLKSTYGGLDVLVNNAGIAFKMASTAPLPEQARATVQTNLLGTLDVCRQLFPLLSSSKGASCASRIHGGPPEAPKKPSNGRTPVITFFG